MPTLQEPLEAREANFKYEQLIGSSGNGRRTMDDIKLSKVETFDSTGPWRHSRSNARIDELFSAYCRQVSLRPGGVWCHVLEILED